MSAVALLAFGGLFLTGAPGHAIPAAPSKAPAATIPADPLNDGAVSVSYSSAVPSFPTRVTDYVLNRTKRSGVRIFQGQPWEALPPMDHGLAGHCGIAYWIVRWRSQNPDVQVFGGIGDTAIPGGFNRVGKAARGGAGYITGNACVSPGLKFANAINGNGSNLVDVDYEYQIWTLQKPI